MRHVHFCGEVFNIATAPDQGGVDGDGDEWEAETLQHMDVEVTVGLGGSANWVLEGDVVWLATKFGVAYTGYLDALNGFDRDVTVRVDIALLVVLPPKLIHDVAEVD
jgi:hypothetical protein